MQKAHFVQHHVREKLRAVSWFGAREEGGVGELIPRDDRAGIGGIPGVYNGARAGLLGETLIGGWRHEGRRDDEGPLFPTPRLTRERRPVAFPPRSEREDSSDRGGVGGCRRGCCTAGRYLDRQGESIWKEERED